MSSDKEVERLQALPVEVDRLIHEPTRYNIMAQLYVVKQAEFLFVLNQTQMTAGNLSSHLSKLEEANYLIIKKEFVGKKPRTSLSLTDQGRAAFDSYRRKMYEVFTTLPGDETDSGDN